MSLISDIQSGVDRSSFRIFILLAVDYFQRQFGALSTLNSRRFIQISFQGLSVKQIPQALTLFYSISNIANQPSVDKIKY